MQHLDSAEPPLLLIAVVAASNKLQIFESAPGSRSGILVPVNRSSDQRWFCVLGWNSLRSKITFKGFKLDSCLVAGWDCTGMNDFCENPFQIDTIIYYHKRHMIKEQMGV